MKQIRAFGALIGALALLAGVLTFATFVTPTFDTPAHAAAISVTAANFAPSAQAKYSDSITCGATITAGQLVYIDQNATPPNLKLADADASPSSVIAGFAAGGCSGSPGNQGVRVVTSDPNLAGVGTLVVGTVYVLSGTAGGFVAATGASATPTDFTSAAFASFVGIAKTTTALDFHPLSAGIAVP